MNPRTRYELIDYDYLEKLSEEEMQWLNDFTEEYIHANFAHIGQKMHETAALKKDCYDRNNARNRCVWTIAKATGLAGNMEGVDVVDVDRTFKKKPKKRFKVKRT